MRRFLISSYAQKREGIRDCNILSIFVFPFPFEDEHLDEALAPYFAAEGPFDAIHFVGYIESIAILRKLYQENSTVFKRIKTSIPNVRNNISLFSFFGEKPELECRSIENSIIDNPSLIKNEMHHSLQYSFIKNNGIVTAARGTHYAKPSGNHSTQFLRAANVLEDNPVAFQIAFWLIPVIGTRYLKRIIVDTSGISSVAFTIAFERLRRNIQAELPIIDSHSSYGGLASLSIPDPNETLILISASTSGGLHSDLLKKGAVSQNIVTLFYLGNRLNVDGIVLCDLTHNEISNSNGLLAISNFEPSRCPECKVHSYAIPITGDQFSTEPARIDEIDIVLNDFSEVQRKILDQLVGTEFFKVFRSVADRDFELYLDVESVFSDVSPNSLGSGFAIDSIKAKWARLVKRGLPVHLKRIVYTNYPGALQMAQVAGTFFSAPDLMVDISRSPKITAEALILASNNLQSCAVEPETATLVLSGCLDDTHELMSISRDLRVVQPGGNITYVAPFFRFSSVRERNRIESNLTFGELGPKTFNLYSVISIELPICAEQHSWRLEFEQLKALVHWADLRGIDIPDVIEDRIEVLRAAPATGMLEGIFWPTPAGDPLQLASDFTMIPTYDGQRWLSQADVFAISTSLFHQYRHGVSGKPRLMYKPYERTVISPESFQRFSDGILQAAFLRAARGSEIAYGNCDEQVSNRMYRFLCAEVEAAKSGRGPALMEYLIAIMIGRLTLHVVHSERLLSMIAAEIKIPDWIRICAQYAHSKITPNKLDKFN